MTWKEGLGGVAESWGGYHCFQRERRGDQSSLTEFKGGTKKNWRPMRKNDRIVRKVMAGSGKLYCDNQNTPTPPPPPHTSTNFSIMLSTLLSSTSSMIISRTWVTPQVFRTWFFGSITQLTFLLCIISIGFAVVRLAVFILKASQSTAYFVSI